MEEREQKEEFKVRDLPEMKLDKCYYLIVKMAI